MSKYKVKRKKTPKEQVKIEAKKINWKLYLVTFVSVVLIFALYRVGIYFEFKYIIHIYAIALTVCLLCYAIINQGFSRDIPTPDELPESIANKDKYIEEITARRKKAKKFLIPVVGILITLAFDMIDLIYIEPFLK